MNKKQREEAKRLARIARAQSRYEAKQGVVAVEEAVENAGDLSPITVATEQQAQPPASNGLKSKGNGLPGHPGDVLTPPVSDPTKDLSRKARVYGVPLNPRIRLIEFDDGTHGQLWVKLDADRMLNWRIWVKPDADRPNPPGCHWVLDGSYNWRGIRIK